MKNTLTRLFILSALLLPAAWAWASGPPVVVTHSVTGYRAAGATAGFDLSLQVRNPGDAPLSNLSLSLAPMPPFFKGWSSLEIASLAPQQTVDFVLHLEGPSNYPRSEVALRPLHFIGKYQGPDGALHGFPVRSQPGGAQ